METGTQQKKQSSRKKWYERMPHPVTLLFGIMVFMAGMSYILPAGEFERELVDGRQRVIPGSYHTITQTPLSILDLFRSVPLGFKAAIEVIMVVFTSGIMFGILNKTGAIENAVGTLVKSVGHKRREFIVVFMTFLYGLMGVAIGYENNIALMPIAVILSLALGGDLMLGAGIGVGGVTVGFGLSPINPYTVGTGHKIAEMPLFSGAELRSVLCLAALCLLAWYNLRYFRKILRSPESSLASGLDSSGLTLSHPLETYTISRRNWLVLGTFIAGIGVMLFGIFRYHWYLNEISALFLMVAIAGGTVHGINASVFSETVLKSVANIAPGAFMVGFANSIRVVMETGSIGDTIAFQLSEVLNYLPTYTSAIFMTLAQSIINLLIPSGSGQALATLPIMIPVGEVLGLTRQTTILAFQVGDGVTNLFNPTLGGLIAMLSVCRVPFDRWLRFVMPMVGVIMIISWAALVFSVYIEWGPV
jgi:uncharacterized ion transporter superfamily protein YfcC